MSGPGYRTTATCQENHDRFIRRIVESETVWSLSNDDGYAYAESNKGEKPSDLILFWSDKAYAKRAGQSNYPGHDETPITLFDFLFRWLPGMAGEGVCAGTNWTGDLVGLEYNAYDLRLEIEAALSPEQKDRFNKQYDELMNNNE